MTTHLVNVDLMLGGRIMADYPYRPGEWPNLAPPDDYARLVRLARRRLVGCEHHAEDVVSLALIRWRQLSPDLRGVARLEQVILSEAYSLLRRERRLRGREARSIADRSLPGGDPNRRHLAVDGVLLAASLRRVLERQQVLVTGRDLQILDLLEAGFNVSEVSRELGCSRHHVTKARQTWRRAMRLVSDQATEAA